MCSAVSCGSGAYKMPICPSSSSIQRHGGGGDMGGGAISEILIRKDLSYHELVLSLYFGIQLPTDGTKEGFDCIDLNVIFHE